MSKLVNLDESEWTDYVPTPLKCIEFDSNNYFGLNSKLIDKNLDYLINNLEESGKILPTWTRDRYLMDWEIAKSEWIGILTLDSVLSLKKFNRIEN